MSSQLLSGGTSLAVAIAFIISIVIVAVIKGIIKWLHEIHVTRRLETALKGVPAPYRESVIRALGEHENAGEERRE